MGVNGIYGLSGSGLDVESMVKVGMMSKQSQYDKMQQQYTKNEWKKTELVNVYSTLQTFNNSTLSQYKMSNNMDAHTAESSNSAVKVTANASAPIMRHTVSVEETATNAYLIGTNEIERLGTASSTSTQLKDVLFANLESDSDDNTKVKDASGNSYNKDDVAFSFFVGDGVNSGITSTDKNVATATANSSSTSGDYTVNITSMESKAALTSNGITRTDSSTSEMVMAHIPLSI